MHIGLLIIVGFFLHALQYSHISLLIVVRFFLRALEYLHIGLLIIARFCLIILALERMLVHQNNWHDFVTTNQLIIDYPIYF